MMPYNTAKSYLFTGLVSILPIAGTYWIIIKLFHFFSSPGRKIVEIIFSKNVSSYVPELFGFIFTILFIYLIGLLITNVFGKRIYQWMESMFSKIPVINAVYSTIKQITTTISSTDTQTFKKVVFIEYPRQGIWTLALVTGESINKKGVKFYHIFLPTTPNPTSGYMLYIPQYDTQDTDMSIEEGLKVIVSGGMLASNKNQLDLKHGIKK